MLGQRPYVDDIHHPGMLYAALLFSDHPRRSMCWDRQSRPRKLPGVIRVFTAADVPGDRSIGLIQQDWPLFVAVGEVTRYVGDVLAGVVAETEAIAASAVALIEVEYEVLEPLTDPLRRWSRGTRRIHPTRQHALQNRRPTRRHGRGARPVAYTATGRYRRSASSTVPWNPRLRSPTPRERLPSRSSRRARASTTTASRSRRCSGCRWNGCGCIGGQRRRLRRQGGPAVQGHAALFAVLCADR